MAFSLQHKYVCVTMNNHITNWNNFTVISATYLQDLYDNKCISYVEQAWEMLVGVISFSFLCPLILVFVLITAIHALIHSKMKSNLTVQKFIIHTKQCIFIKPEYAWVIFCSSKCKMHTSQSSLIIRVERGLWNVSGTDNILLSIIWVKYVNSSWLRNILIV